jgi:hypothetical protein
MAMWRRPRGEQGPGRQRLLAGAARAIRTRAASGASPGERPHCGGGQCYGGLAGRSAVRLGHRRHPGQGAARSGSGAASLGAGWGCRAGEPPWGKKTKN